MNPYEDMRDQEVLLELDQERRKFTKADDAKMHALIAELQARCVYPKETVTGTPVFKMVDGYGAFWHQWRGTLECPHCKADLRDHKNGPPFKREIAFYNRDRDRTEYFICPDCEGRIER
jgi:hypothetical protein